jgi:hypothetical protein
MVHTFKGEVERNVKRYTFQERLNWKKKSTSKGGWACIPRRGLACIARRFEAAFNISIVHI